jgi:DNA-binding MarR family transcriptional regulator
VLSVLARSPGASNADLARACNTTPQAMIGVLATLERAGLTQRHPHPTHGRIRQVTLSSAGRQRLYAAQPAIRELEHEAERGLGAADIATVKTWLVTTGQRLERRTPHPY